MGGSVVVDSRIGCAADGGWLGEWIGLGSRCMVYPAFNERWTLIHQGHKYVKYYTDLAGKYERYQKRSSGLIGLIGVTAGVLSAFEWTWLEGFLIGALAAIVGLAGLSLGFPPVSWRFALRGGAMSEIRRRYEPEFKSGAVRIVLETGKPIARVARDLGLQCGYVGELGETTTCFPGRQRAVGRGRSG